MVFLINAGEKIVCPNGHFCGQICIDVQSDGIMKAPESGSVADTPISVDLEKAKIESGDYICMA